MKWGEVPEDSPSQCPYRGIDKMIPQSTVISHVYIHLLVVSALFNSSLQINTLRSYYTLSHMGQLNMSYVFLPMIQLQTKHLPRAAAHTSIWPPPGGWTMVFKHSLGGWGKTTKKQSCQTLKIPIIICIHYIHRSNYTVKTIPLSFFQLWCSLTGTSQPNIMLKQKQRNVHN